LTANPEPLAPFFRCAACSGTASCCCPPHPICRPGPTGERPGHERLRGPGGGGRASMCRRSSPPLTAATGPAAGASTDRQGNPGPGGQADPGEATPQPLDGDHAGKRLRPRSTWLKCVRKLPGACRFSYLTLPFATPSPWMTALIPGGGRRGLAPPSAWAAGSVRHPAPPVRQTC